MYNHQLQTTLTSVAVSVPLSESVLRSSGMPSKGGCCVYAFKLSYWMEIFNRMPLEGVPSEYTFLHQGFIRIRIPYYTSAQPTGL